MFGKFTKALHETFFPLDYTCDICGIETFKTNLCPDCIKTVKFNNIKTCPVCGRKTAQAEICTECKARLPQFKKAVSPLVYDGGTIKLVAKFKNGGAYLKEYFADLLAEKLSMLPRPDCIVCVPSTKKSVRRRGYDQIKLLAKSLSKRTGIPVIFGALEKAKDTPVQKGLTRDERKKNVKGVFKVLKAKEIKGKSVLILDDVLTTGATADEMCRVIKARGAAEVYFATIASVEYKV